MIIKKLLEIINLIENTKPNFIYPYYQSKSIQLSKECGFYYTYFFKNNMHPILYFDFENLYFAIMCYSDKTFKINISDYKNQQSLENIIFKENTYNEYVKPYLINQTNFEDFLDQILLSLL